MLDCLGFHNVIAIYCKNSSMFLSCSLTFDCTAGCGITGVILRDSQRLGPYSEVDVQLPDRASLCFKV